MNDVPSSPRTSPSKIATLVDHHRDGRFVFAFCPICDHTEETEDKGTGREQAGSASIAKIKVHIRRAHRAHSAKIKVPSVHRP